MFKDAPWKNHPKELWILALTEMCERYSFWGVGNLLVLFLIEHYQFTNVSAAHVYGMFAGCAAFLPLLGGYIADRWNYQSPLLIGALANAIGCFMLSTGNSWLLYPALFIIALGYGVFTPSILTVLGYAYRYKPHLREAGFSIYYASINVGVFLALSSLGTIAKFVNWNTSFLVAGLVQVIGLFPLAWYLLKYKEGYQQLHAHKAMGKQEKLTKIDKDRLIVIGVFYLFSFLFWIAYMQGFSSMAIFVHEFMDKTVGGIEIPEGVFLSSQSFFLILLAPLLSMLYAYLNKFKQDPAPVFKTAYSLLGISVCFLIMMFACAEIPAGETSASVSWKPLILAYFMMAVGEMLLAPVGLSLVSKLAPKRYTALAIGAWYVFVGLAFYIGGLLAGLMGNVGSLFNFFAMFVLLTAIPGALLLFFGRKVTSLSHSNLKEGPIEPL
jgi:POT family proton-dependent oligopeptide transporter